MKLLLADDEPLARDRLRRLLADIPDCELAAEARNGEELLQLVRSHNPDVVLLDIHMPGLDGIETARQLKALPLPPAVVFITAYSEHALSAFDAAASGYLLKPVRRDALNEVLQQCQQPRRAQVSSLTETEADEPVHLLLRRANNQYRVDREAIFCCLADQKLTRIIHRDGEDLSELSLQELEALLGDAFLRVHRSALVARNQVRGLEGRGVNIQLKLSDVDQGIPVSRRRLPIVRRLLRGDD